MDQAVKLFRQNTFPLASLGLATATLLSLRTASWIWTFLRPSSLSRYHHGKRGSTWALVTGSSDGIGYAFVEALLERGFNVVMHGRNQAKLDGLVADLQPKHPSLQIRTVLADAGSLEADVDAIAATVQGLPGKLTVLINNVGGVHYSPMLSTLTSMTSEQVDHLINVNARFQVQITRALLPLMYDAQPALVMSISSTASIMAMPCLSIYSACKAFNAVFNRAIQREAYALGADIETLAIIVGNTRSAGNKQERALTTCSSKTCANGALDRVGCGSTVAFAWWRHAAEIALVSIFPDWFLNHTFKDYLDSFDASFTNIAAARKALVSGEKQKAL